MTVHHKLDLHSSSSGRRPQATLPKDRAVQHQLCRTLCAGELWYRDAAGRDLPQNVQRLLGG